MKLTKKAFEEYLNETVGQNYQDVDFNRGKLYGSMLRRKDPIAFNVGYNEWVQENSK